MIFELIEDDNILAVESRIEDIRRSNDDKVKNNRTMRQMEMERLNRFLDSERHWKEDQKIEDDRVAALEEQRKEAEKAKQVEALLSDNSANPKPPLLESKAAITYGKIKMNRPVWHDEEVKGKKRSNLEMDHDYDDGGERKSQRSNVYIHDHDHDGDNNDEDGSLPFDPFETNHDNPVHVSLADFYFDNFIWHVTVTKASNSTVDDRKRVAKAGGYESKLGWRKSLERAFDSLFV